MFLNRDYKYSATKVCFLFCAQIEAASGVRLMKNLLEDLNDCLQYVTVYSKYKQNKCHISVTDDRHHAVYVNKIQKICVATPHLPVNGTKFTRISLDGECGWQESKIGKTPLPPFS